MPVLLGVRLVPKFSLASKVVPCILKASSPDGLNWFEVRLLANGRGFAGGGLFDALRTSYQGFVNYH